MGLAKQSNASLDESWLRAFDCDPNWCAYSSPDPFTGDRASSETSAYFTFHPNGVITFLLRYRGLNALCIERVKPDAAKKGAEQ